MSTSVVFNGVTYTVPTLPGEAGWATTLSSYLQALATGTAIKTIALQSIRTATTTPVSVLAASDYTVVTNLTVPGAVVVNLPAGVAKQIFVIVDGKGDAATNNVTVTANGAETINGSSTHVLNVNYSGVMIQFDGTGWKILGTFVGKLTASRALVSDANGKVSPSAVTATELGYVAGVTSAVQTQINTKAPLASPTFTGTVTAPLGLGVVHSSSGGVLSSSTIVDADVNASAAIAYSKLSLSGAILNADLAGSIADSKLSTISTAGKVANSATTATSANTASAIVARDVSGNFTAGTITAALSGNVTGNVTGTSANVTGIVATANGGTGQNSTATFPTSGVVVTESATQTLLNKTVVSSTAATTGALTLPSGTAAQRPTPTAGMTRLNTDSNSFEGYANGIWSSIGGGLNEQPVKNYLKTYAEANVAPGTVSIAASGANITVSGGTSAFYADAGAAAIVSDASTLLRGANNYLTAVTSASTSGAVYVQFPVFKLETADAGKPISISFDVTGNTLDNDWDVVIANYDSAGTFKSLIPVAGNASSMTGTASAKIPTGTSTFNGFFISTSTAGDVFALRLRRRNGSVQIRVDSLMVGNTPVRVGAAVTDWQAYTPTYTGWGTPTSDTFYWRRSGDTLHVRGRFVTGTTTATEARISFPTGLTSSGSIATLENAGFYQRNSTGPVGYEIYREASVGYFTFGRADALLSGLTKQNGSSIVGSGAALSFEMSCPIASWSSNVQMADRAVEYYGSNDGSGGTSAGAIYTTGQTYGTAGSQFVAVNATTASSETAYRVDFPTPRQATDSVLLEVTSDAGLTWVPVEKHPNYSSNVTQQSGGVTGLYGMRWNAGTANTNIYVYMGNYGRAPSGNGYATVGATWALIAGNANFKWRVRLVSSGAQIGGAISTANIVGRVDGSTVGSGYIGEVFSQQRARGAAIALTTNVYTDVTGTALTLTPGVWSITASVGYTGTAASVTLESFVGTASGTGTGGQDTADGFISTPALSIAVTDYITSLPPVIKNISTSTPYYLKIRGVFAAGAANAFGTIKAIRIA